MDERKVLTEQDLGNIILCDPITSKGKRSLRNIGLTLDEVNVNYFYENLYVESKYHSGKRFTPNHILSSERSMYYNYTIDAVQFDNLQQKLLSFDNRFRSDSTDENPLIFLGVAGNGKSIEINRRIRTIYPGSEEITIGRVYLDLEQANTIVKYGYTYNCRHDSPPYLFCTKLLDCIMKYVRTCRHSYNEMCNNFTNIIKKENICDEKTERIFHLINKFQQEAFDAETELFKYICNNLLAENVYESIECLLDLIIKIMFCSAPEKKHYLIIDNIEQYIKLDDKKIQIPTQDIVDLYSYISRTVSNLVADFNRIKPDMGWKVFKMVLVLRRTSLSVLMPSYLHTPGIRNANAEDITGHFQISEIWTQKRNYIWEAFLKDKYDTESSEIITILDWIMKDDDKKLGISYQSLIAPLMSFGIRRNALAQSHAAFQTYMYLKNENENTISQEAFKSMIYSGERIASAQYMFRRALMEIQFKWMISNDGIDRWKNMCLGNLGNPEDISIGGRKTKIHNVELPDSTSITLARRILSYLSYFSESGVLRTSAEKHSTEMFSSVSLYSLIKGVFINPVGKGNISDADFLQFAKILLSLGDMSNDDTRAAPFIILDINNRDFHKGATEERFADLLKTIYNSGEQESADGHKYSRRNYSVRINEAGHSFLIDWQPSFSFMAALNCFTIPPLFFLKNIPTIKYVIDTVYYAIVKVSKMYKMEKRRFLGSSFGSELKIDDGKYIPLHKNKKISFIDRAIELQSDHLNLYADHINKNYSKLGWLDSDKEEVLRYIKASVEKLRKINEYPG